MRAFKKRPRGKPEVDCQDSIDNKDVEFKACQSSASRTFSTDIAAEFALYRAKTVFWALDGEVQHRRGKPSEKKTLFNQSWWFRSLLMITIW